MEVYANGKNIPSYQFGDLFVQGEKFADTINFVIDRTYNGIDLVNCSFCIKGLTSENWEVEQVLPYMQLIGSNKISLAWNVSDNFTFNSGTLQLEIRASMGDAVIIKYSMPPVQVKPAVNGKNGPLPETVEQAVSQITEATAAGLARLQQLMDEFDLDTVSARLDRIEEETATYLARPEVIAMTRSEYEAAQHKENSLYVITEEV
ncbi:MAG: hypothetical protein IKH75_17150 [Ruminococcus sp.]|nr:hypothetical protein [Ruminococcus sp.]